MQRLAPALAAATALLAGCGPAGPEVIVVHDLEQTVLVRGLSILGCKWDTVLSRGQATTPQRCLPGDDRIHFQRFDAAAYCRQQIEAGNLPDVCTGFAPPAADSMDAGVIDPEPVWFNYQTITVHELDGDGFHRLVLRAGDLEQDFSVPGPYGH